MHPKQFTDPDECVEAILAQVGSRLVVGAPLGIGKPNHLLNALYRRAARDPSIHLTLITALSLEKPRAHGELERRFLEPFVARVFGDYPELDYMAALRHGSLPANVEISEFYFKSGSLLRVPAAQRNYVSSNYTHVARDMLAAGINVVAQAVAREDRAGVAHYSLSSNPDVTLDILPGLKRAGRPVAVAGMVNRRLPFMYGAAELPPESFDFMVDAPSLDHHLFAVPPLPIDPVEHMIGLYASTLIRDGGTVQLGIGALGDAFVYSTQLRHADNRRYRDILENLGLRHRFGAVMDAVGELGPYRQGLYAGSEMFGDGLLHLYEAGILKRRVYDQAGLQALLDEGRLSESIGPETLGVLADAGVIRSPLGPEDVALLKRFGILRPDVDHDGAGLVLPDGTRVSADLSDREGQRQLAATGLGAGLVLPDGTRVSADLSDREGQRQLAATGLGARLTGGVLTHAAFFLGSQAFYDALHRMPEPERRLFAMEAVSTVNELFSDLELERVQHRDARFLNICMKMTLLGAAVSDALEDGRVVSGVGGQYNFVAMAHALTQARSILMLKATHMDHGRLESNLLWSYGHCTIPRHLRDMVVTEYGIADLRGKRDHEVVAALLNLADSRFQEGLLQDAKRAGKLPPDYAIPDAFRQNTPERLKAELSPLQAEGLFPDFPFGHAFTPEELGLGKALKGLQAKSATLRGKLAIARGLFIAPRVEAIPYLVRMGLDRPQTFKQRLMARLVAAALEGAGVT